MAKALTSDEIMPVRRYKEDGLAFLQYVKMHPNSDGVVALGGVRNELQNMREAIMQISCHLRS